MTKYSDIEIQTAKSLLEDGYRWITRERSAKIWAYKNKPHRNNTDQLYQAWDYNGDYFQICTKHVPIFLNVTCADKEPVSLEGIVHPPILDDAEKRYLKGVIRPFRNRVKYITKRNIMYRKKEYIYIHVTDDCICLPCFRKGSMYKGMEIDKNYSLEELGL